MHKKNIWLVLALVVALIAVIGVATACGGSGGTTNKNAVKGGTLNVYINEPVSIEPLDLEESEGTQVGQALFDSLASFDFVTSAIMPAAAASWAPNADATVWTFHLVKGAKFHDGTKVTAGDFI